MQATFNPASNKLTCAELHFDTGCISSYLNRLCNQQANHSTNGNSPNNSNIATHNMHTSVMHRFTNEARGIPSNATFIPYGSGIDYKGQPDYAFYD